jgi:hypothetical protein
MTRPSGESTSFAVEGGKMQATQQQLDHATAWFQAQGVGPDNHFFLGPLGQSAWAPGLCT